MLHTQIIMLRKTIESIERELKELEDIRDRVIKESRDIVKISREIIHHIHKREFESTENKLEKLRKIVKNIVDSVKKYPQIYYSGLIYGPLTEYVEAEILYNIVSRDRIPTIEELQVESVPYLLGLGDVVGELRRIVVDSLREGNLEYAEKIFKYMEDIYENLSLLVIPDALIPGLRGKVDFIRKMVEITRADLMIAKIKVYTYMEESENR